MGFPGQDAWGSPGHARDMPQKCLSHLQRRQGKPFRQLFISLLCLNPTNSPKFTILFPKRRKGDGHADGSVTRKLAVHGRDDLAHGLGGSRRRRNDVLIIACALVPESELGGGWCSKHPLPWSGSPCWRSPERPWSPR